MRPLKKQTIGSSATRLAPGTSCLQTAPSPSQAHPRIQAPRMVISRMERFNLSFLMDLNLGFWLLNPRFTKGGGTPFENSVQYPPVLKGGLLENGLLRYGLSMFIPARNLSLGTCQPGLLET